MFKSSFRCIRIIIIYYANQLTVGKLPVWIHLLTLCSIRKRMVNNFVHLSTAAIYCYTPVLDYNHCHGHPRGLFRPREAPLYSVRLVRDPDGSGVGQGGKCMHTQICSRSIVRNQSMISCCWWINCRDGCIDYNPIHKMPQLITIREG